MRTALICIVLTVTVSLSTSALTTSPARAEWETAVPLLSVEDSPPVDLFQAMESGQVEARFIPTNAARANVIIANKTDKVLHLQLPKAIAAVPVLGQLGPQFGGQPAAGAGGSNQAVGGAIGGAGNQGMGNGLQGLGMGGGNQGFGNGFGGGQRGGNGLGAGGFMRIAPQKTRKLKATTVCLEHGKAEPNPRLAYRMIPVSEHTQDERVASLCTRIGRGGISQNAAQAAAWHLANDLSWQKIAKINRVESRYLGNIKMFKPAELAEAKAVVQTIAAQLGSNRDSESAGGDYESAGGDYGQIAPR